MTNLDPSRVYYLNLLSVLQLRLYILHAGYSDLTKFTNSLIGVTFALISMSSYAAA